MPPDPGSADPLRDDELHACLAPWLGEGASTSSLVLAVSGGPDSTALMGAAALTGKHRPLLVATVDHGLRPESDAEAAGVAALACHLGLSHRTLAWTGPKPGTGVQAAARAARYGLLARAAREAGASHLLTAHTQDDQAETVLMRLCAGSDLPGLAGMRRETRGQGRTQGLVIARPFLDLPKSRLVATCRARGWPFITDPANADPRFTRPRLRLSMPALAAEGLSTRRLATLAARAARTEAALTAQTEAAWTLLGAGADGTLDGRALAALPEAIALRLVARLLATAAPPAEAASPPRLERLERLVLGALLPALAAGRPLRRTLGGVLVAAGADGGLTARPAPPRVRCQS